MAEQILVSVIMPAFNAATFVGDAIRSVLAQGMQGWELIIVDDRSQDGTASIVEEYSRADARVRLVRKHINEGPASARNSGLDAASGRYVAFLDSDDIWLPDKLANQLRFMSERDAAVSFTAYRRVSSTGRCGRLICVPKRLTYHDLLKNTAIATSTVIVDREKTGRFKMPLAYYDDFALWLMLLKRGFVAHGLSEDLMRYRVVGGSVSRNKARSALWVWKTYREVESLSPLYSAWCFAHYAVRAAGKYAIF